MKVGQSYELRGRSRWPCGRLIAEIVGSNPAGGMYVRLLCVLCCDELVILWKESYRVCVCVFMIQKPQQWGSLGQTWTVAPQKMKPNFR